MFRRSDQGVTLNMSALKAFYGDQFTLSTQLIKPNDLLIPSTDAAPQFLEIRNFPPVFIINFFTLVVEYNNADTSAGKQP